jgi:intraflagellar transport protein 172
MISNAGELTLIEYGNNEVIGTCRTEYVKKRFISVRAVDKKTRLMAYLLDMMTISIQDLNLNSTITQISHDSKIDYL